MPSRIDDTYGSLSMKPAGFSLFLIVTSLPSMRIVSPGRPITLLMKYVESEKGGLNTTTSPREGLLKS